MFSLGPHVFDSLLLSSPLLGPRSGGNLTQRHLVQERRLPEPGGPDLSRAAAQSGAGDAVSQEGQQLHQNRTFSSRPPFVPQINHNPI